MSEPAEPQDAVKDPVCGRPVDPLRARAVGIFGGVTHYFCSQECKAQFGDPRSGPTIPNRGPEGTERRVTEPQPFGDMSGQWFVGGEQARAREPTDRFDDLSVPVPKRENVSPSVQIEARASRAQTKLWLAASAVILVVAIGIALALRH